MRYFNTAGPCRPDWHYMIPAEKRLPEASALVDRGGYFVVHAPRQTGKTTALIALADRLTAEGKYAALYFSCEAGQAAGDDYPAAQRGILDEIRTRASVALPSELQPPTFPTSSAETTILSSALHAWARSCPRPLVLLFDEIDSLRGQSMISVLRQLRAGYSSRPESFPWSVVLCGLRDVRDYKMASGGDADRLGTASPFNIKLESLRLGDFTEEEVATLYGQYTDDTGQAFSKEALVVAYEYTAGQPWLTNALAREIVDKIQVPTTESITAEHMAEAKERLILARATHLDSLLSKLTEPRVRRVLEPLISGGYVGGGIFDDDVQYVRDLGLVGNERQLQIANAIYREIIVRVLGSAADAGMEVTPQSFVTPDGRLNLRKMLNEFVSFWKEQGDLVADKMPYHEVAPQLVLMAFLQRIVNGGGYVEREYGVGRGRIDLLVRWPLPGKQSPREWQREAIELKVWRDRQKDPLAKGLTQLEGYLARLGLETGVLVIFDRRTDAPSADQRTKFEQATTTSGRPVTVLRA